METGLQTLQLQWRDATVGWFFGDHVPIARRDPLEQADFWLQETERVLQAHPDDAALTMGAAWVLDAPGEEYNRAYIVRVDRIPGLVSFPHRQMGTEADFELRCHERCVQLAALAAELDPSNVEWWRGRALLLRQSEMDGGQIRDLNYLATLDECARHDPENALYDYLAADHYWESSAEIDFSGGAIRLVVRDPNAFAAGVKRFEAGQSKPHLAFGVTNAKSLVEFLQATSVPIVDQVNIAYSIHVASRPEILSALQYWQKARVDAFIEEDNFESAFEQQEQYQKVLQQYSSAGNSSVLGTVHLRLRHAAYVLQLLEHRKPPLTLSETAELNKDVEDAWVQMMLGNEAHNLVAQRNPPRIDFRSYSTARTNWILMTYFVGIAPALATLLFVIGLVAAILNRLLANDSRCNVGFKLQALGWIAAASFTVILLGIAPAGILSVEFQSWLLTFLTIGIPVFLGAVIALYWLRGRAFRFSLRTLLIVTTFASVVLAVISISKPQLTSFTQFPFDLSVPAIGWKGMEVSEYQQIVGSHGTWFWTLLQWEAYAGPYVTIPLWIEMVAILFSIKLIVTKTTPDATDHWKAHLGAFARSIGRTAFALSALLLMAYLILAPEVLETVEQQFRSQIEFIREPENYQKKVEEALRQIEADPQEMAQIRAQVQSRLAAVSAQEP